MKHSVKAFRKLKKKMLVLHLCDNFFLVLIYGLKISSKTFAHVCVNAENFHFESVRVVLI